MVSTVLPLPFASRTSFAEELSICRILNGMWQVAGGHGPVEKEAAIAAMFHYVDAGYTTWDVADHYGPAESWLGEFRQRLRQQRGPNALNSLQALTKWVPLPGPMTQDIVRSSIERSRQRMGVECLDLVQFHWCDYGDRRYLDALKYLADLRELGLLKHIGVTNFDTEHLHFLQQEGISIVSNQVQCSVVDRRSMVEMASYCQAQNIKLLTYGTLCGGLLSQRFVGVPNVAAANLTTVSLRKHKHIIDVWGGWSLFQDLLQVLSRIARKHQVSIANVAVRYVLDLPMVAGGDYRGSTRCV